MNLEDKKKFLGSIILVVSIISAGVALATTYGVQVIEQKDPYVKILPDASRGSAPFEVVFSSLVNNFKGDITYQWDFGNGEISNEQEPQVIYEEAGEYVCQLTVTDQRGRTGSDYIRMIVKRNRPPIVDLSINYHALERKHTQLSLLSMTPLRAYAGDQQRYLYDLEEKEGADAWGEGRIIVTAQIDDPEDDKIVSYDWTVQTVEKLVCRDGEELYPVHTLSGEETVTIPEIYTWIAGDYLVTLTVTDAAGNEATGTIEFEVNPSIRQTMIGFARDSITRMMRIGFYAFLLFRLVSNS